MNVSYYKEESVSHRSILSIDYTLQHYTPFTFRSENRQRNNQRTSILSVFFPYLRITKINDITICIKHLIIKLLLRKTHHPPISHYNIFITLNLTIPLRDKRQLVLFLNIQVCREND